MIDNGGLFTAYPALKGFTIESFRENSGLFGVTLPRLKVMRINKFYGLERVEDTLIHEIQHYIQSVEGFTLGSNEKIADMYIKKVVSETEDIINAHPDIADKIKEYLTFAEKAQTNGDTKTEHPFEQPDISRKTSALHNPQEYLKKTLSVREWQVIYRRGMLGSISENADSNRFFVYIRNGGEVEVRTAGNRRKLTPRDRRDITIEQSEDVPREWQILDALSYLNDKTESAIRQADDIADKDRSFLTDSFTSLKSADTGSTDSDPLFQGNINFQQGRPAKRISPAEAAEKGLLLFQDAWHGTPHVIEGGLTTQKIGTGEGNQTYGWGLYAAEKRRVADGYAARLGKPEIFIKGVPHDIPATYLYDKTTSSELKSAIMDTYQRSQDSINKRKENGENDLQMAAQIQWRDKHGKLLDALVFCPEQIA